MLIALYARVSTTRQADNDLSLPDQLRQMQNWAKANGHVVVKEYIEPGASATDDKRPVFQAMIKDALIKPAAFNYIVVHSLSRFFRDGIEFGVYERKLAKNKVQVVSITQPTSDDAGGEMMRRIITLFDEHQSKENAKHTSRSMIENAIQGYWNGSKPPFGYQTVAVGQPTGRGRQKKKLAIHEDEATIVKLVYSLYLNGFNGQTLGCKDIAKHLSEKGLFMRGSAWNALKTHCILSDSIYMGEFFYNVMDSKNKQKRPPSEWVKAVSPAIIDASSFEQVRVLRESRAPNKIPPRRLSSPTLLTGILKCGKCGHGMTLVTGKSGKYKYYKCTSRHNQGNHACTSGNLPMEKMDALVMQQLADYVLAPDRLQTMMTEIRTRISSSKDSQQERVNEINRELKKVEERQLRLLDAIETGVVELDEVTQKRAQQLKASREALLIDMANVKRDADVPAVEYLKASQVDSFGKALRQILLAEDSSVAKSYLNILVGEIVVEDKDAIIKGSYDSLAKMMYKIKVGDLNNQVPTFISMWRPQRDSNSCYRRERAMS